MGSPFIPTNAEKRLATPPAAIGAVKLTSAQKKQIWKAVIRPVEPFDGALFGQLGLTLAEGPLKRLVVDELSIVYPEVSRLLASKNPDMGRLDDPIFFDALEILFQRLDVTLRIEVVERARLALRSFGVPVDVRDIRGTYRVIALTSPTLQEEIVAPALLILSEARFENPAKDFADALHKLRGGEYPEAIHKACNAMEGVARVLLEERGVDSAKNAWSGLRHLLVENGLVPSHLEGHLGQVPATLRNQPGSGHGAGSAATPFASADASLAVHEAGAVIVYLTGRTQAR